MWFSFVVVIDDRVAALRGLRHAGDGGVGTVQHSGENPDVPRRSAPDVEIVRGRRTVHRADRQPEIRRHRLAAS
jgi:hypothetical protein